MYVPGLPMYDNKQDVTMMVPKKVVGFIVGPRGESIDNITKATNVDLQFGKNSDENINGGTYTPLHMKGYSSQIDQVCVMIDDRMVTASDFDRSVDKFYHMLKFGRHEASHLIGTAGVKIKTVRALGCNADTLDRDRDQQTMELSNANLVNVRKGMKMADYFKRGGVLEKAGWHLARVPILKDNVAKFVGTKGDSIDRLRKQFRVDIDIDQAFYPGEARVVLQSADRQLLYTAVDGIVEHISQYHGIRTTAEYHEGLRNKLQLFLQIQNS